MKYALLLITCIFIPHTVWAGAWTLKQGHLWAKITGMTQSTTEEYVASGGAGREPDVARIYEPGDRARYRENGHYESRAFFVDMFYGLTDRIDLGVQIPFFRQEFENVGFRPPNVASGFSDVRGFTKINLIQNPFVSTLKLGFKAPTGDFVNQDGIIPVGEGQWDFDLIVQTGKSFWPVPVYANLDVGYRIRLKNKTISRDPGDEWFFNAEIGYNPTSKLLLALKVEGIRGKSSQVFNLRLVNDVKHITYFAPTLLIGPFQNLSLETSLRLTAGGRNFPAGHMWIAGISYANALF